MSDIGSPTDDDADSTDRAVLLELPDELREELKAPIGPIETDPVTLRSALGDPVIAVGDVVTYHLLSADRRPDVAVVDGRTQRGGLDDEVASTVTEDVSATVENPAATLSEALLETLVWAVDEPEPTTILVEGEEDLATLPAVLVAPAGASVVYGQPGAGMVHVQVDDAVRADLRDLLERFDGDVERALTILGCCND